MTAGRPTEYTQKILKAAQEFADAAKKMALDDKQSKPPPKVAELALVLGVSRSTIYEWKKNHREFSDTIEDILSAQEIMLVDNGLGGTYNPTIAKTMLAANHGYADKQELSGPNGGPVQVQGIEISFKTK
jgi:hypothetical protein